MKSELVRALEQRIEELEEDNKNLRAENDELNERILDLEASA